MDMPTPLRLPDTAGDGESASHAPRADVPAEPPTDGASAPRRIGTVRRWVSRFISLMATLAVVGIAALALALTAVPAAVGGHALTVLSGSMVPEFSPGAMVVDKPVPASSLRVGDVITYASTDGVSGAPVLITHRIVKIDSGAAGRTFTTQGDANNMADGRAVEASQIRGKVWYSVPYIGTARNFLLAKGAGLILGGAAGLIAAVWFLLHLLRSEAAPSQNATAAGASEFPAGRHRARDSALVTALVGLLVTGSHLATQPLGTYAEFSDQQTVQVEISVGSAAPAP
jgi:signal peptidase